MKAKSLHTLLEGLNISQIVGDAAVSIADLSADSRQVKPGSLYAALRGATNDGHQFIDDAISAGAAAVICEKLPDSLDEELVYVVAEDIPESLGLIANAFFDKPSEKLKLVGVTGTNGKTSTVTLLYNLFNKLGYKVGLISTIENKIGDQTEQAKFTTPDVVSLHRLLYKMYEAGCDYVFMEVSSHAVVQKRIAGAHFTGAVFTNISHDHLDYHGDFKSYIYAKKMFFDNLSPSAFALVNTDDKRGTVMVQNTSAKKYTYALHRMADFRAKLLESSLYGISLKVGDNEVSSRLIGEFNAYNLMAAYATAVLLGESDESVLITLSSLPPADGRFQQISLPESNIQGVVDYAHTPDALEKVLQSLDQIMEYGKGRIITVVGCGGDRDKTKRPKMAAIACQYSDTVVLTADNPRTEDPQMILADMVNGLTAKEMQKVLVIADRREAIRTAVRLANNKDSILVAGKGHETYQEINGVRRPFDDREVLKLAIKENIQHINN